MKYIISICVTVVFIFSVSFSASAQDGVVPYSVQGVLPDNQVNNEVSYFDIEMETGDVQTLEVTILNSSEEPITVNVNNHFAATNSNGIITYDGSEEEPHESMTYPLSEIASLSDTEVEIDPSSRETVSLEVRAPEESFDGVILGGFYFTMEPDDENDDSGVAIQNQYSYALAVQIREAGNETEVEPELDLTGIEPGIVNHRTGVQTEFVNTAPVIISGLDFTASIYGEGAEEPIYTRTDENFTVAPNTRFNYPVMFDNQRLEPGTYTFRAQANNDDYDWNFEETFEITEETADEANEEAVELEQDNSWMIYLVIGLSAVIALLVIVVIYLALKRKN